MGALKGQNGGGSIVADEDDECQPPRQKVSTGMPPGGLVIDAPTQQFPKLKLSSNNSMSQ